MPRKLAAIQLSLTELAKLLHLPTGVEITRVENAWCGGYPIPSHCELILEGDRLPDCCEIQDGRAIAPLDPKWKSQVTMVFDRWK